MRAVIALILAAEAPVVALSFPPWRLSLGTCSVFGLLAASDVGLATSWSAALIVLIQ